MSSNGEWAQAIERRAIAPSGGRASAGRGRHIALSVAAVLLASVTVAAVAVFL